jgi:DNA-directed RNA polymerase subunit beta
VQAGDILVGKITPKGESPMTPEEKLLRAIFGEKASDVRDTSLRLPPGVAGTVVEVRVFNRHGIDKDERALRSSVRRSNALQEGPRRRAGHPRPQHPMAASPNMLVGKEAAGGPKGFKVGPHYHRGAAGTHSHVRSGGTCCALSNEKAQSELDAMRQQYDESKKRELENRFNDKVEKVQRGDELPPGVMKMVKVFVAVKRKIQPGDKMAGRHGNKGVVSRIVPDEDMPFLEDGTPVDIVLNPLGVPSRMNVGQILETHLGWACRGLGKRIGEMVDAYRENEKAKELRKELEFIYGKNEELPRLQMMTWHRSRERCATAWPSRRRCSTVPRKRTSTASGARRSEFVRAGHAL